MRPRAGKGFDRGKEMMPELWLGCHQRSCRIQCRPLTGSAGCSFHDIDVRRIVYAWVPPHHASYVSMAGMDADFRKPV